MEDFGVPQGGREDNSIHFTPFGIFYPGLLLPEA
jgi:hypothetical protein